MEQRVQKLESVLGSDPTHLVSSKNNVNGICLPMELQGPGSKVTVYSRLNWNLETFVVVRREENWRTQRKTLGAGKTQPTWCQLKG